MSVATLDGNRVVKATIHLPAWGVWWAEVSLDEDVTLTGDVTLVVADATFVGAVVSGGVYAGRSMYRICGGKGKWGTEVSSRSYANDAGVKHATLLSDAALACGETIDTATLPTTRTKGGHYVRENGPASCVLNDIAPHGWYVGEDGVTRIGSRATSAWDSTASRMNLDLVRGYVEVASDEIATLVPGVTVDGIVAVDVHHTLDGSKIRTQIWGAAPLVASSRGAELWREIFETLHPWRYSAKWEYRVVTLGGYRADLQPTIVSSGMPDLRAVRVKPGLAGSKCLPALGSLVLVDFINADPSRPIITSFDDADAPGFLPTTSTIDASTEVQVGGSTGLASLAKAASTQTAIDNIVQRLNLLLAVIYTASPGTPVATLPIVSSPPSDPSLANTPLLPQTVGATTKVRAV